MKWKTLFLDRDGVINRRIVEGYVTRKEEFEFLPGVLDAMSILTHYFKRIIIVTNQQGIGKGIFTFDDLNNIHQKMIDDIIITGGMIDKIYAAPDLEREKSINRKPNPGMGYQAKNDFPDIDFNTSVMVGDSCSDLQFGKNLGMSTVFISNGEVVNESCIKLADQTFNSLFDFASDLARQEKQID